MMEGKSNQNAGEERLTIYNLRTMISEVTRYSQQVRDQSLELCNTINGRDSKLEGEGKNEADKERVNYLAEMHLNIQAILSNLSRIKDHNHSIANVFGCELIDF